LGQFHIDICNFFSNYSKDDYIICYKNIRWYNIVEEIDWIALKSLPNIETSVLKEFRISFTGQRITISCAVKE